MLRINPGVRGLTLVSEYKCSYFTEWEELSARDRVGNQRAIGMGIPTWRFGGNFSYYYSWHYASSGCLSLTGGATNLILEAECYVKKVAGGGHDISLGYHWERAVESYSKIAKKIKSRADSIVQYSVGL